MSQSSTKDTLILALRSKKFTSVKPKFGKSKRRDKYLEALRVSPPMRIDEIARHLGRQKNGKPMTGGILAWYRRYSNRCRRCGDDPTEHGIDDGVPEHKADVKCIGKGKTCPCKEFVKSGSVQIIYIKNDPIPFVIETSFLEGLQRQNGQPGVAPKN